MRHFIILSLFVAILAVGFSVGGMAFMDHENDSMAMENCKLDSCSGSPVGKMGRMNCIALCLQAAADYTAMPAAGIFQVSLLILIVAAFFVRKFEEIKDLKFFRSDQGIARLLIHGQLATVMIRD